MKLILVANIALEAYLVNSEDLISNLSEEPIVESPEEPIQESLESRLENLNNELSAKNSLIQQMKSLLMN